RLVPDPPGSMNDSHVERLTCLPFSLDEPKYVVEGVAASPCRLRRKSKRLIHGRFRKEVTKCVARLLRSKALASSGCLEESFEHEGTLEKMEVCGITRTCLLRQEFQISQT